MKRLKRIPFKGLACCLLLLALMGSIYLVLDALAANKVRIYVAKKIITMDEKQPFATAVAIKKGFIVKLGSLEYVKEALKGQSYVLDERFKASVLMPGFIDAHQHPLLAGMIAQLPMITYYPQLKEDGSYTQVAKTKAGFLREAKKIVMESPPKKPVLIWGYDVMAYGGHLNQDDLNTLSLDHTVVVWDASLHHVYVNGRFFERYKLDQAILDRLAKDKDGQPLGQFLGSNQAIIALKKIPLLGPKTLLKTLSVATTLYQQGGITTIGDLCFGQFNWKVEHKLLGYWFRRKKTPIRTVAFLCHKNIEALPQDKQWAIYETLRKTQHAKFRVQGLKFFSDDAYLTHSMQMDMPGFKTGIWLTKPEALYNKLKPWWQNRVKIHIHSNGTLSQRVVLKQLKRLYDEDPWDDHRFTFEHFGQSHKEQIKKMKALGALASVNPWYVYRRSDLDQAILGIRFAENASRLGSLARAGVRSALHTDSPVAPPLPLYSAWIAVNRMGQTGQIYNKDERVSIKKALAMITIDAAYVLGMEDEIGSISEGKRADFTLLSEDPFSVKKKNLADMSILGTLLSGQFFKNPISE